MKINSKDPSEDQSGTVDSPQLPSYEQLQQLLDSSRDMVCSFDVEGKFIYVNQASLQILGYLPEELIGTSSFDLIVEEDKQKTLTALEAFIRTGRSTDFENRYCNKEGSHVYLSWSCKWEETQRILFCTVRDITERKSKEFLQAQYEEKVKRQHAEMQEMLERITDGFFALDEQWRFIYGNSQVERMVNEKWESYLTKSFWDCFPSMVGTAYEEHYQRAMKEKVPVHFEEYFPPFDRWFSVDAYPSDTGLSVFFRDVTLHKKAEKERRKYGEKMREQNETMLEVLEQMEDGFATLDKEGRVIYWNSALERIAGISKETVLGKIIWNVLPEIKNSPYYDMFQKFVFDPTPLHKELKSPFSHKWLELTAFSTRKGISIFFSDITEKKKTEEQVQQLSLIAKETSNSVWLMDRDFRITWVNDAFTKLTEYTFEEARGRRPGEIMRGPETDLQVRDKLLKTLESGNSFDTEFVHYTKSRKKLTVQVNTRPIFNERGEIIQYFVIETDLTAQKAVEEELHRLSLIAKETVNAVFVADLSHRITWINNAFTKITGYTLEDAVGKIPSELLDCAEADKETLQYMAQKAFNNEGFHVEVLNRTKNEGRIWCDTDYQPVLDQGGKIIQYFCIITDITERKRTEEELRKLSLVAQQTDNIVALSSPENKVVWVNDAFTRITGYTFDEVVGKQMGEVFDGPETDPEVIRLVNQKWRNKEPFHIETLNYKKNGGTYWSEVSCQPVFDPKGKLLHFFSVATDITERKNLEKELEQQRKQTTAAIIKTQEAERAQVGRELHDNVNQVLTSVKLYQELILTGVDIQKDLVRKSVDLLQESINEIRSLSKRLSAPTLGSIKLKDSVKELLETVASTNKFEISLDTTIIEELDVTEELHLALYRILQEHLTNVLKYAEASQVQVGFDVVDCHLLLKVKDNGKGFDTKQKRNGIGITNMMTRAESLNGTLQIISAPGIGCKLTARFPLES